MSLAGLSLRGLGGALTFLTRVPAGHGGGSPTRNLARAVPWFPIVGALVGALTGAVYALALELFPTWVAATLAVGAGVAVTGAFHEDGLADTADALVGANHHERALEILRDPRLGTYGVAALIVSFFVRVAAVAAFEGLAAMAALISAHALGRSGGVAAMLARPADRQGLGADYVAAVTKRQILIATCAGVAVALAAVGWWALLQGALAGCAAAVVVRYARRRIGGTTGDVLGAVEQIAEIATLLVAVAVVHNGWGELPWWR
ncbi:MAG TPA: adenosylcobinamide-GDP ribazoletransferase [Actinomycetota bacterium]|nr:adenosylcobinamide-GDP ribazoletransferase [Actinomycetota bacterium]